MLCAAGAGQPPLSALLKSVVYRRERKITDASQPSRTRGSLPLSAALLKSGVPARTQKRTDGSAAAVADASRPAGTPPGSPGRRAYSAFQHRSTNLLPHIDFFGRTRDAATQRAAPGARCPARRAASEAPFVQPAPGAPRSSWCFSLQLEAPSPGRAGGTAAPVQLLSSLKPHQQRRAGTTAPVQRQ